jgi:DNA helicase-2/ATP-dependent DNA helicase PcrA
MDFVEKDEKNSDFHKESIPVTPKDEEFVLNQIKEVYKKIKSHQFFVGCGEENCKWCEFVRGQRI